MASKKKKSVITTYYTKDISSWTADCCAELQIFSDSSNVYWFDDWTLGVAGVGSFNYCPWCGLEIEYDEEEER